jgi:hypothetical protein
MSLKSQVTQVLDDLRNGGRIDRAGLITMLPSVVAALNEQAPSVDLPPRDPAKFRQDENTPVRMAAKNWGQFGVCKRCLKAEAPDGSIIVRIHGTGWWHDACYRVVNPDFYVGM